MPNINQSQKKNYGGDCLLIIFCSRKFYKKDPSIHRVYFVCRQRSSVRFTLSNQCSSPPTPSIECATKQFSIHYHLRFYFLLIHSKLLDPMQKVDLLKGMNFTTICTFDFLACIVFMVLEFVRRILC